MVRLLLLLSAFALSSCGITRKWFIEEDKPLRAELAGVGSLDFMLLKQHTDFVHAIVVLHNGSGANLYWKPIDATTTQWGFNLKPLDAGITVRPRARRDEAGMLIPPGGEMRIAAQWFVSPEQGANDWPWELTIDGLMAGDVELPQQRIAMPDFTEWRR